MGNCISSTSFVMISRDDDFSSSITPAHLGIILKNPSFYGNKEDYSAVEPEKVQYNFLRECNTTYLSEHVNIGRSTSDSLSSSTSSPNSDSFDSGNLLSFDGLNKRTTNRYDIGLEILKSKIHLGADPKTLTTHGDRTSLMFSVMANDFSFTKQLVELGVDVNGTNRLGETALGLAIEFKREEIAKYLRAHGATEVAIPA